MSSPNFSVCKLGVRPWVTLGYYVPALSYVARDSHASYAAGFYAAEFECLQTRRSPHTRPITHLVFDLHATPPNSALIVAPIPEHPPCFLQSWLLLELC